MPVDPILSELAGCMGAAAESNGLAGRHNIEAALYQCRLILVEACVDDGVDLDQAVAGIAYGVIDGDE